jgi:polyisoprenoid-binding protein YceI
MQTPRGDCRSGPARPESRTRPAGERVESATSTKGETMRITRKFAWAAGAVVCAASTASAADHYDVDTVHSTVLFRIKHMTVAWFYGRFADIAGTVLYDEQKPETMSVDIKVKTDSIRTDNEKRDQHLKSPDFFAAKQYPELTFKSTAIKFLGNEVFEVAGDLTCHGVTKPITIKLEHTGQGKGMRGEYRSGFFARFPIKRSDFGMTYMMEGLGDDIEITVSLECIRK